MKTILALFGYVKIPKEAVQLSLSQESFIETQIELTDKERLRTVFAKQLSGQKTLTKFLQTGRMTGLKKNRAKS